MQRRQKNQFCFVSTLLQSSLIKTIIKTIYTHWYCNIAKGYKILIFFQMRPVLNVSQNRTVIHSSRNPITRAEEQKSNKKSIDEAFKRTAKRGPVTWASLALVALAGGGLLLYVRYLKEEKEQSKKASKIVLDVLMIIM